MNGASRWEEYIETGKGQDWAVLNQWELIRIVNHGLSVAVKLEVIGEMVHEFITDAIKVY